MKENGKLKVVWLCHFSNYIVREKINLSKLYFKNVISRITMRHRPQVKDYAVWVSNAIHEFEKFDDIDLTIIFPYLGMKGKIQYFDIGNIHYVCYKSEDDNLIDYYRTHILKHVKKEWNNNRRIISAVISSIKPDVIHIIGAENPYYSIAALDIPSNIPCVTSLQTLLSAPDFLMNFPMSDSLYGYRSELEKKIIQRSDYIATRVDKFRSFIKTHIKPDAIFLKMVLAVGEDINTDYTSKEFDFVYFAANINKACDDAIEAFAIAHQRAHQLTLNISGAYDEKYKAFLDKRINELGLSQYVTFTGSQLTHDDVLKQIKKSRFALLPLKVDLISGTIREAMACGLPVVSTITPATPELNSERESILLSDKGDYESMAANMLKLVENEDYANVIRQNAIQTVSERYGNEGLMKKWREAYYQILDNFNNGIPFSNDLLSL